MPRNWKSYWGGTAVPDEMDFVQEQTAEFDANALREHYSRQQASISRTHCIGCGGEIPLKRRLAVNGCRRCLNCQEILENWRPL